jgi:uncharacterized glyoxalase superfamily protein PhnB
MSDDGKDKGGKSDAPAEEETSLAVSVGELLESVQSEIDHDEEQVPEAEPSDPKPPPLPAADPDIDESLAVSVNDLLSSVSDEVSQLEPSPARPVKPRGGFLLIEHRDLKAARTFYEERLGFEVLEADEAMVRLRVRGFSLIITSAEADGPPPGEGIVMRLNVNDLGKAYGSLMANDIEVIEPPTERPWGDHELVIADPAGYRIALVG